MMKRAILYIDRRGADVYYSAPGNITVGPQKTGTVVVWAYATSLAPGEKQANRLLRIVSDPANETISALHNEHFYGWAVYDGSGNRTFVTPSDYAAQTTTTGRCGWQMLACSWDFATGHVRVFVNDDYDSGWVECGAPAADAMRIYIGPQCAGDPAEPVYIQYVAAWDGKLTAVQIAQLYREGPRYIPVAEDGAGTFTFLATFNAGYGADIASGDGELYTDLCPSPDRYCRIPDGQFEFSRQTYFVGKPAHDGAEFDRVAAGAVLPPGFQPDSYSIENDETEARVVIPQDVNQSDVNRGPLAPGARVDAAGGILLAPVRGLIAPTTLRMRLRIDRFAAPAGQRLRLGPIDYIHYPLASADVFDPNGYGSLQSFQVADDASNTRQAFVTDLDEETGFWDGAVCVFITGANAGRALKVAQYDATAKRLTLEAELPADPQPGDIGVVAHWARLQAVDAAGTSLPWQNLPVILDETHGTDDGYFPEVAFVYVGDNTYDSAEIYTGRYRPNYVTFDRGRTVPMEGRATVGLADTDPAALLGRPAGACDPAQFFATIRLQKIEFSGPWQYQLLRADGEQGPSLADNFFVWVTVPGEQGLEAQPRSVKVWRQRGVQLGKQRPTKWPNPDEIRSDITGAWWRSTWAGAPMPVEEQGDRIVACVVGEDDEGVRRLGYIVGQWDAETGRISWQDETPPEGKSNPFFEGPPLSVDRAEDTPTVYKLGGEVYPLPDGKWMLRFGAKMDDPDHSQCGILLGAEDRWSFDRQRHWWRDNPLVGVTGGVDVPTLTGGGTGTWANRDGRYLFAYDAHTEYPARRYMGFARGKSILFGYTPHPHDIRPLIGVRSSDGRVWSPLPDGRQTQPLCCHEYSTGGFFVADDSTVLLSPSDGDLSVSEDGVHWQRLFGHQEFLPGGELSEEGYHLYAVSRFRLGDRTVYWYDTGAGYNMAYLRLNGETYYELQDGETEGFIETAAILRPGESWDRELVINADPAQGSIRVEIIDADTERPLAGFGADDCNTVPDSVEHYVRWKGLPLSEITCQYIRLRFWLRRDSADDPSPRLYGWKLLATDPPRPQASDLKVEGQVAPAGVTNPKPTFSWTYSDPRGLAQTAYRVLVATSEDKLAVGQADIWDSGVVESSESQCQYDGPPLASYRVYFWTVLVRNSEGVWSQ